jgi:hypothetical protein
LAEAIGPVVDSGHSGPSSSPASGGLCPLLYGVDRPQVCSPFDQFLVIKTLDSELDPDPQLRQIMDPDLH